MPPTLQPTSLVFRRLESEKGKMHFFAGPVTIQQDLHLNFRKM